MPYLLDANILIDANMYYYPLGRVPQFWDWLVTLGQRGLVKIPREIYDEVTAGSDEASQWLKKNTAVMLLNEDVSQPTLAQVISRGYAPGLPDDEIEKIGKDPFLIAYALADPADRIVVSNETSAPRKTGSNRKIPDVCQDFNVRHINIFALIQALDFHTR